MKTTLKRGIGRSGSPNGNGHAVLPPTVFASRAYYRQPPRRRGFVRVAGRFFFWLLVIAAVVASGVAGGAYLYAENDIVKQLAPKSASVKAAEQKLNVAPAGEPATALVIGYDRRYGEQGAQYRSDTIMLVRADPVEETLTTLSFPRDLLVEVRCPGRGSYPGRINEAYANCKERGTLDTVRALTNLPINYLVTVNFRGFKQIVAKLGGVWIDVDRRYLNTNSGPSGFARIDLQPGYQKLNGSDALDFVRYRHTDSDLYRVARQQLFLEAFKESVTSSISATKLLKIVKVVTSNVEVGTAGGGGPSLSTLKSYALLAYTLPDGHFAQAKLRPDYLSEDSEYRLIASPEEIRSAVWDFTHPRVERVAGTAPHENGPKAPPARNTTLLVLNGNGVPGAAATTSAALAERKYVTISPPDGQEANAPRNDYPNSEVYYQRGNDLAHAAARKLAKLVQPADVKKLPGQLQYISNGAMVVLVVGRSFGGLEPPGGRRSKEGSGKANVTSNPAATLPLLRAARKKVPFPLMLPRVLERSSTLDYDGGDGGVPVRVYRAAGHKAVRIVYETGAHEFWGVQMTDWDGAPILAEPNREKRIKGRTYELHYAGEHLRAVVIRYGGASYWVVNTLVNSLSNETMMAIAKGLRPLPRR